MASTCPCGEVHDENPARRYYVTARTCQRCYFLAGPYLTHVAALAKIDRCKVLFEERQPDAVFYDIGTTSIVGEPYPKGRLNI